MKTKKSSEGISRAERWRREELADSLISRIVAEAGGSPERLIAWAKREGLRCSQEDEARGYVTWYTAASYLADRELKRWPSRPDSDAG